MKNRVFIVCEPTRRIAGEQVGTVDLTPAAEWGNPIVLLQSNQSLLNTAPTIETLCEKLRTFDDNDYLIPIGDPVLMCMAATVAAMYNGGRLKMLKWDRLIKRYVPIQVDIKEP